MGTAHGIVLDLQRIFRESTYGGGLLRKVVDDFFARWKGDFELGHVVNS